MAKNILIDTGYWFALYEPKDQNEQHLKAQNILPFLEKHRILIPWPSLYETLNTEFVKKHLLLFKIFLRNRNVELIDDEMYKNDAYEEVLQEKSIKRGLSLVDIVMRNMLLDVSLKIDYLITFNQKDFYDVCAKRGINMYLLK